MWAQLLGTLSWDRLGSEGLLQPQPERQVLGFWGSAENRECACLVWVGWPWGSPRRRALGGAGPVRRVWPWGDGTISGLGSSQAWGALGLHSFIPLAIPPTRGHWVTRPCAPGQALCQGHNGRQELGICLCVAGGVIENTQCAGYLEVVSSGAVGAQGRSLTQRWGFGKAPWRK